MLGGDQWRTPSRGTYALVLRLGRDKEIRVGRLGGFHFPSGYYFYVGSARGPGGIEARVARHVRRDKRPHWHADYLLRHAQVLGICRERSGARLECTWARALLDVPGAMVLVRGFGSSDCRCETHLVYCPSVPSFHTLCGRLESLGGLTWIVSHVVVEHTEE